jgi:L-amino acid N-acyltransferase YncA
MGEIKMKIKLPLLVFAVIVSVVVMGGAGIVIVHEIKLRNYAKKYGITYDLLKQMINRFKKLYTRHFSNNSSIESKKEFIEACDVLFENDKRRELYRLVIRLAVGYNYNN